MHPGTQDNDLHLEDDSIFSMSEPPLWWMELGLALFFTPITTITAYYPSLLINPQSESNLASSHRAEVLRGPLGIGIAFSNLHCGAFSLTMY